MTVRTIVRMKRCTKCGERKPVSEFSRSPYQRKRDGRRAPMPYCKACQSAMNKEYREANAEKLRAAHLKKLYNIEPWEYDAFLYRDQGGGCGVCGRAPREDETFHVDHDHATGENRGVLCTRCNTMLGFGEDDPDLLEAAAKYLRDRRPLRSVS